MTEAGGAIVGAICARGGSKGVPRKNLRPLAGRPLIAHTVECALACETLDRVVVSTEDDEIARVARAAGAEVPFRRPAELASDDASKWHVFRHLADELERRTGAPVAVVADLDTGTPLRRPEDVDAAVRKLLGGDADVVVTAWEAERNPYFNMVEVGEDGLARVVVGSQEPVTCRQHAPTVWSLSPAVYAIRRPCLDRFEHWSRARMQIHPIPHERAVDIDSDFEWKLVEGLMAAADAGPSRAMGGS